MKTVMLHVDFNNYFASVESVDKPEFKSKPMAVCGDPKMRHGIVLSKNDLAKECGVLTGESSYSAKSKCPNLVILKPDYSKYLEYAKKARDIYYCYSDKIIPYGLDEAWIDMSAKCFSVEEGKSIADEIRERVKKELKLTASVGVSFNYVFSKLASDMKKPDATSVIPYDGFEDKVRNIPAFDMLFVGSTSRKVLRNMGILTIGDLANQDPVTLSNKLGKKGYMLWQFANGNDSLFDPCVNSEEDIKSIGNTITPPKDIDNDNDVYSILYLLSCTVSKRLLKHNFKTNCITINYRLSDFTSISRQKSFLNSTDNENAIFQYAYSLFKENHNWTKNVRSIGLKASKLICSFNEQLSLFDYAENNGSVSNDVLGIIEGVKKKFSYLELEKSATTRDFDIGIY